MQRFKNISETLKSLGVFLLIGASLFAILVLGVFIFFPTPARSNEVITVPVDPAVSKLEQTLAQQEAADLARLTTLQQTLTDQTRRQTLQIEALKANITVAQQQLDTLQQSGQELAAQVETLQNTRAENLAAHQAGLQQARTEYSTQQAALQNELERVQSELSEAVTQLQR